MKINTAKICTDACPSTQPVIISDVGVKGWINDVQRHSHTSDLAPMMFKSRSVTKFMENSGQQNQRNNEKDSARRVNRFLNALSNTMYAVQPPVSYACRDQYGRNDHGITQQLKNTRDGFNESRTKSSEPYVDVHRRTFSFALTHLTLHQSQW